MGNERIEHYFQAIRRRLAALRGEDMAGWAEIDAALENLQVTCEQMQTNLETLEGNQEELFQQQQYYQNLFQFFPIASLITDINGFILEANQAIAQLLKVSPSYLMGRSLAMFIAQADQATFWTQIDQLTQHVNTQTWQTRLCPFDGEPVLAELHVAIARDTEGRIENLRIGVYHLSQSSPSSTRLNPREQVERLSPAGVLPIMQLPPSLNGLRVLVVDDEADAREFILAVLSAYGIYAKAVTNTAEALAALEQFRPDVLLSDIRMPGEDGYSLIRQIRALEGEQGKHLPAAAITAYIDEDREKAIAAGFETYLHKLAKPIDWVAMVVALAEQASDCKPNF